MLRGVCCLLGLALPALCLAADPVDPLKVGVTDLTQVDDDFRFQGEYAGPIWRQGQSQFVGLQVVAQGKGEFAALLSPGGLPGNGYQSGPQTKLAGQRDGDRLTLRAENLAIVIAPGYAATATDAAGHSLGLLQPWQRYSSTTGAVPPAGAIILFNGADTGELKTPRITEDGLLGIGTETNRLWRDFTLHAEFRTPYMPHARGQARGNSGFYLQRRYEVQVLDSFGLEPQFNDAGSLYRTKAPDLNMTFPPLSWQTYDIQFTAARFDESGAKVAPARITVWHNGVPVQSNYEIPNKTGAGKAEGPEAMPILLQDHGNAVHFRNVWIVDHSATPVPAAVASCVCPAEPLTRREVRQLRRGR